MIFHIFNWNRTLNAYAHTREDARELCAFWHLIGIKGGFFIQGPNSFELNTVIDYIPMA